MPRDISSNFKTLALKEGYIDLSDKDIKKYKEKSKKVIKKVLLEDKKAYIVFYTDYPEVFYITFALNKDKAKYESGKYFYDTHHPLFFQIKDREAMYYKARSRRLPELDEYYLKGKVPIVSVLEYTGKTIPCNICGKDKFSYKDYDIGRCFILKGEGDYQPKIEGKVICYDCAKKLGF